MQNFFRLILALILIAVVAAAGIFGYRFFFGKAAVETGVANEVFGSAGYAELKTEYKTENDEGDVRRETTMVRTVNVGSETLVFKGLQFYAHEIVVYSDSRGRRAAGKWQEEALWNNKTMLLQGEFSEVVAVSEKGFAAEGSVQRTMTYDGKSITATGSYRELLAEKNGEPVVAGTYLEEIPLENLSVQSKVDYTYKENGQTIDMNWVRYTRLIKPGAEPKIIKNEGNYSGAKERIFIALTPYEVMALIAKNGP